MNQKEIENVISLEPIERYKHFIKKVADWEVFFTMIDDEGNYVLSELDDRQLLPLWSAKNMLNCVK